LADRSGLDLARARAAAANLDGESLDRVATQATFANAQLEGGMYIAVTTIIVILLIVIILLVI
jgi:heme/copper-type cytochrome/quinol oxidase subunit 2